MTLPLGAIQLAVVSCITTAMAIIAILLRLWSRRLQNHSLVMHDYLALAGMFFTACTVSVYLTGEIQDLDHFRSESYVPDGHRHYNTSAGFAAGLGVHVQELMATAPEKLTLHIQVNEFNLH